MYTLPPEGKAWGHRACRYSRARCARGRDSVGEAACPVGLDLRAPTASKGEGPSVST